MIPHAEALRKILSAGIQAPSAENVHYFWLEVGAQSMTLHATGFASWLMRPDIKMLALMSFGAVIENITLRAQTLGFQTHATWQTNSSRVVELSWQSTAPVLDPLEAAISTRHTNRRFYRRAPVANAVLEQISAAAHSISGARLYWLGQGPQRSLALRLIRIAETERFGRKNLHQEMFNAIRFECGWVDTVQSGLPPAALQVELAMRWPFAGLRHWRLMRPANVLGAYLPLGFRSAYLPCVLAPHLGLLMFNAADLDTAHVQAGRALQRLWLSAQLHGLALQPMAATTVLAQQISGPNWVREDTKKRLSDGLKTLSAVLEPNEFDALPCMLFRLGRAQAPTAVASRRALEVYLKPPPSI